MKEWSSAWKGSKKPKKQRKYRLNAPISVKRKLLNGHLSKELRQKYNRRSITIIKGDKVKILTGQHKGHTGKIERVDVKRGHIFITGIEVQKKDGNKTTYAINPSNIVIQELKLDDKKRIASLDRKKQKK